MAELKIYNTKRRFDITSEPKGKLGRKRGHAFVIQKHDSTRLHYDLRLELDGVMKSWAVTRGPSLVPGDKRLAVQVEDHPIEYNTFEGTIPEGEYGGGTVMIWDRGTWEPENDAHKGLKKGHLSFKLNGEKLHGGWHLVRMHKRPGEKRDNWLMIKQHDEAERSPRDKDILKEAPLSVATGRSLDEIAEDVPRKKKTKTTATRTNSAASKKDAMVGVVKLTHPDRVYWEDAGITKRELAAYYVSVWKWMAPHLVGRAISLVRCPEGAAGECFFQKHAAAGISTEHLHLVPEKGGKIISVDNLSGLITLVQSGVLEVHTRGSTIDHLDKADRLVFDLDPGPGTTWTDVVAAARDIRDRLAVIKLKTFVKTSGGKGLHVVLPIKPTPWDEAKKFAHAVAAALETDAPDKYVATATKSKRRGRIFIDHLRNSREATAVAPYSTRARPGAPVSAPIGWPELGALKGASQYTVANIMQRLSRLKKDPWANIGRIKQPLPQFK